MPSNYIGVTFFLMCSYFSAFDAERERQYRANEKQLKLQIAQLEAALKGDLNDKNTLLDKLNEERGTTKKV